MAAVPETEQKVIVAVRIRKWSVEEGKDKRQSPCVRVAESGDAQIICGANHSFTFDHVFDGGSFQSEIYDECVSSLVEGFFMGFNATILAYGQTGSGKTYTMGSESTVSMGTEDSSGIIPRFIDDCFSRIARGRFAENHGDGQREYAVKVQFLEIYGDDIRDLLDRRNSNIVTIREEKSERGGEVQIRGATEREVKNSADMMAALEDGSRYRTTSATKMNLSSSRSHAIFTVVLETTITFAEQSGATDSGEETPVGGTVSPLIHDDALDGAAQATLDDASSSVMDATMDTRHLISSAIQPEVRKSKFHFVDLAGSERLKRTGSEGHQLKEGIDINKGLLALGNVISALGDETKRGRVHVPYRDSKLTRMLQDSLGGNSKTLMICCVSPGDINFHESLNALRYANRSRNIKNKPVVNRDPTSYMIHELKHQVNTLIVELARLKGAKVEGETGGGGGDDHDTEVLEVLKSLLTHRQQLGLSSPQLSPPPPPPSSSASAIRELHAAHQRAEEAEMEVRAVTEKLKASRLHESELNDRVLFLQGECNLYKMKLTEVAPAEAEVLAQEVTEGAAASCSTDIIGSYKAEIADLKVKLKEQRRLIGHQAIQLGSQAVVQSMSETHVDRHTPSPLPTAAIDDMTQIEAELTLNISKVLAATHQQIRQDEEKLQKLRSEKGKGSDLKAEDTYENGNVEQDGSNVIEAENKFRQQQRRIGKEMEQLSTGINAKEELVAQLKRSQTHYEGMRDFYSQRLLTLEEQMQEKEAEKERLSAEVSSLEEMAEEAAQKQERLGDLRHQLEEKEQELQVLRSRQQEMQHLGFIQGKYTTQVEDLNSEISHMKKKRVELSKMLAHEKRRHMAVLNDKMREIDRLKRGLEAAQAKNAKLDKDKERVDQERQILQRRVTEVTAQRQAHTRRLMGRAGGSTKQPKFDEKDMKMKRQLENRVAAITRREEMVEQLRGECEQQLRLLDTKRRLEEEQGSLRQVMASLYDDDSLSDSSLRTEENAAMNAIETRMEELEGQLMMRQKHIAEMQVALGSGDGEGGESDPREEAMQTLRAIPATHDILRLLFEMLVSARSEAKEHKDQLLGVSARHRALQEEHSATQERLADAVRAVDLEATRARVEYEQKLFTLHQRIHHIQDTPNATDATDATDAIDVTAATTTSTRSMTTNDSRSLSMMLAINQEQYTSMKATVNEKDARVRQLEMLLDETETSRSRVLEELDEKCTYVRFLEDERDFFREMADDLKNSLLSLDGQTGDRIIEQIVFKERMDLLTTVDSTRAHSVPRSVSASTTTTAAAPSPLPSPPLLPPPPSAVAATSSRRRSNSSSSSSSLRQIPPRNKASAGEGAEVDSMCLSDGNGKDHGTLLAEFSDISMQIERMGWVEGTPPRVSDSPSRTEGGRGERGTSPGGVPSGARGPVFDRLTNPRHYTGRAKKIFELDRVENQQKVRRHRASGPASSPEVVSPALRETRRSSSSSASAAAPSADSPPTWRDSPGGYGAS